jgi:hypothetical protein
LSERALIVLGRHPPPNQVVVGSIPTGLTNDFINLAEMNGLQTPACVTTVCLPMKGNRSARHEWRCLGRALGLQSLTVTEIDRDLNDGAVSQVAAREKHPGAAPVLPKVFLLVGSDAPGLGESVHLLLALSNPYRWCHLAPVEGAAFDILSGPPREPREHGVGIHQSASAIPPASDSHNGSVPSRVLRG